MRERFAAHFWSVPYECRVLRYRRLCAWCDSQFESRNARLDGLLAHPNLLGRRPESSTLSRRDDLNAIRRVGHEHSCMSHT